jgi:hypothetical protein
VRDQFSLEECLWDLDNTASCLKLLVYKEPLRPKLDVGVADGFLQVLHKYALL